MTRSDHFDQEHLSNLQRVFEDLIDLDPGQRQERLLSLAREEPELADQVNKLLAAHDRTNTPLDADLIDPAVWEQFVDRRIGSRVGAFEVIREIGAGGMGKVYEGRRVDGQFEMRVAIKFLRGDTSPEALHRFSDERRILAALAHPNIAALIDGGATPDGEPWFVMEYVEGEPITIWADARSRSIPQRLDLFLQVCAAVQSAHQNLVVHRDLKPGNILVTTDGTVKLLDFGIARLLRSSDDVPTLTQVGTRAFTPDYASPEQLSGGSITTVSDVYSLGVILYQLITGSRPLELTGKTAAEMHRIASQVVPLRPSATITMAQAERLTERSLPRVKARLEGDLDAIILMALRKEPERRYGSVEEFAADIRRYLRGHPVKARPDSLGYRMRKLAGRNQAATAALGLALTALFGGLATTVWQARQANTARVRGDEVKSFLVSMLGAAQPDVLGRDATVRAVLDSAMARITQLPDPLLQAEIREIVGGTWLSLGEYDRAEQQYRIELATHRALAPGGSREVARALTRIVAVLEAQGRSAEADSVLTEAEAMFQRFGYRSEIERADLLDRRGQVLVHLGRMPEAAEILADVVKILRQQIPPPDSTLSLAYANLGVIESELGNQQIAESLLGLALSSARRVYGEAHPQVAAILSPLATIQEYSGHLSAADSTYRLALDMRAQLLGREHPDYAWTLFNYADHLGRVGQPIQAARRAREVLALRGVSLDDNHPTVAAAMRVLGQALVEMDSLEQARPWLWESWQLRKRTLPKDHWLVASSESSYGDLLGRQGRFAEAEKHLLAGLQVLRESRGDEADITREAKRRLDRFYEKTRK